MPPITTAATPNPVSWLDAGPVAARLGPAWAAEAGQGDETSSVSTMWVVSRTVSVTLAWDVESANVVLIVAVL